MTALSDAINQRLETLGWSGDSLRTLSERSDGRLSKDAVRLYRGGRHGTPSEEVLEAWSDLLQLPVVELRTAAGIPTGENEPYVPPAEASRLNTRQREALDELIRAFVGQQRLMSPRAYEVLAAAAAEPTNPARRRRLAAAPAPDPDPAPDWEQLAARKVDPKKRPRPDQ